MQHSDKMTDQMKIIHDFESLKTLKTSIEIKDLDVSYYGIVGSRSFGEKTLLAIRRAILDPFQHYNYKCIQLWMDSFQKQVKYSQNIYKIRFLSKSFNEITGIYYHNMDQTLDFIVINKLLNAMEDIFHSHQDSSIFLDLEEIKKTRVFYLKAQVKYLGSINPTIISLVNTLEEFKQEQLLYHDDIKNVLAQMYEFYHKLDSMVNNAVLIAFKNPMSKESTKFMNTWVEYSRMIRFSNDFDRISKEYPQRVKLADLPLDKVNHILQEQQQDIHKQRMERESYLIRLIHDTVHSRYDFYFKPTSKNVKRKKDGNFPIKETFLVSNAENVNQLGKELSRDRPGTTNLIRKAIIAHKAILLEKMNQLFTPELYDVVEFAWKYPGSPESMDDINFVINKLTQSGYQMEAIYLSAQYEDRLEEYKNSLE